MEAALRSAYFLLTGKNPKNDAFKKVRGVEGWKEAIFEIEGVSVKVAVVSGLGNTRKLIEAIKAGKAEYDFVEVMACKRGCIAGGGQPLPRRETTKQARIEGLYKTDSVAQIKLSNENPIIKQLYDGLLKGKEHKLLHTR